VKSSDKFIAIIASWLIMNVAYALITALQYGKTNDSGIILFWSGIYVILSWVIFLWLPTLIFRKIKFGKAIILAGPILAIYAGIIFTLLLGKTFQYSETYTFYLPYAMLTGLVYGILLTLLNHRKELSLILWMSVLIMSISFYFIFPLLLPSQALRFMPDKIQDKIVSRIVPKLKVGNKYNPYLTREPSLNSNKGSTSEILKIKHQNRDKNYKSSLSASNEYISYELEVENGIITKLSYKLRK